jgi:DNA-binding winged helix-turn-helix (wHTH) protein
MTTTAPGYVHVSARTATHRTAQHRTARGFVLYVGMETAAAAAAGTSLRRLATELRRYVAAVVPGSESAAAVALAPVGAPGTDLDVVRQVLADPTIPPGARPEALHPPPAPIPTGRPGLVIDAGRHLVRVDGETLNLARKEFEILHYLVQHRDRAVGREELLEALWPNPHPMPAERTIDVHIRRLRAKLDRFRDTVRTVQGQGYLFHEHPDITVWSTPQRNPCAAPGSDERYRQPAPRRPAAAPSA